MAKILRIENYSASKTVDLITDSAICVFVGEGGGRPLKSSDDTVTRVFNFRVEATTKALARAAANSFILALREALVWHEDTMQPESWFLREAADGETATRSLIVDFDASAITDGSAIDAHQTMNTELYLSVALTLQNHREKTTKTTLTEYAPTADVAVGKRVVLEGDGSISRKSRVFLTIESSLAGSYLVKYWIGMRPHLTTGVGSDTFLHLWYFDYATTLMTGVTETTETGSYGTNIAKVVFSDNLMANKVKLNVGGQYTAQSISLGNQSRGRYVALVRYKAAGGGTVLMRAGVSSAAATPVAYNEARLITNDGNWWLANLGVVQFPPYGTRYEEQVTGLDAACFLHIDAQQLSGSNTIYLDTITFIPHDHYLEVEDAPINSGYKAQIITNEDLKVVARVITSAGAFNQASTIKENNNFMYPYDRNTNSVLLVYAAQKSDSHDAAANLDNGTVTIYEAVDGYYD